MIYVESKSTDANFNFALENYLMRELDIADSYFIFWRTQPTLMIGRYQNPYQEVNMDYAKKKNINIVRRITGGGTIYTDLNGWQFSFILKDGSENEGKVDFVKHTKPIIAALASMGVDASLSGRNDLLIDGKKFSGNAQFHDKSVSLHHGSLLFNTDIEEMVRALNVDDEKIISKGIKSVRQRVANIADYLSQKITSEEFKDIMLSYLLKDMQTYELTEHDISRINSIKQDKFDTWEWNIGRTPEFIIKNENRFEGGKMQVCVSVEKGLISDIEFYGDFFAQKDIGELKAALIGIPYDKDIIKKKLYEVNAGEYFFKISADEMLQLF